MNVMRLLAALAGATWS